MLHVLRGIVRGKDSSLSIKEVKFVINNKIIMAALIVAAMSIIIAACIAYLYSDSVYTLFWILVFVMTLGVMINYFILTTSNIVKKVDIEFESEDEEEPLTMMRIE